MAQSPTKPCINHAMIWRTRYLRARSYTAAHNASLGLTLIEVLIALAIIAIAMTAIIKSTSQNIRGTTYLQTKTIATWVAEQQLNEARIGIIKVSDEVHGKTNMLGQTWYWHLAQNDTPNKRIKKLIISVYSHETDNADENSLITLEAFVYADQPE